MGRLACFSMNVMASSDTVASCSDAKASLNARAVAPVRWSPDNDQTSSQYLESSQERQDNAANESEEGER